MDLVDHPLRFVDVSQSTQTHYSKRSQYPIRRSHRNNTTYSEQLCTQTSAINHRKGIVGLQITKSKCISGMIQVDFIGTSLTTENVKPQKHKKI